MHKALYGLKHEPRAWYRKIDDCFVKQGFVKNSSEHSLYKKVADEGKILLVCIYLDDLICMGTSAMMIEEFKQSMNKAFEMSDLGLMSYFLGLEVK